MAISPDYLQELSQRTDIAELVGGYVQLRRRGRTYTGLCPFHSEKTPSFVVYPETASFYCFGCGAGGDAITFVKRINNLDYIEAVKFLAARAGMPLPDDRDDTGKIKRRILAMNKDTARFYFEQLNTDEGRAARDVYKRQVRAVPGGRTDAAGHKPQRLCQYLRSRLRYWIASLTWGASMACAPSRSAMVRLTLSTRP